MFNVKLHQLRIYYKSILDGVNVQLSEQPTKEMLYIKKKLTDIYVTHTGKSYDELDKSMDRDNFMSAEEAKSFGIVDHVVEFRKKTSDKKTIV